MFGFFVSQAYAMGAAPQGAAAQDVPFYANPIFMMVIMVVIFWFFLIRPQRQEQKKHQERLNNLKVGDRIITSGGIHGIITNVGGDPIKIKIADNVKIDVSKSAIAVVIPSGTIIEDDKK